MPCRLPPPRFSFDMLSRHAAIDTMLAIVFALDYAMIMPPAMIITRRLLPRRRHILLMMPLMLMLAASMLLITPLHAADAFIFRLLLRRCCQLSLRRHDTVAADAFSPTLLISSLMLPRFSEFSLLIFFSPC